MSRGYYLDNDVVLKSCVYDLGSELLAATRSNGSAPAVLALARHTIPTRVGRSRVINDKAGAEARARRFLADVLALEPTAEETELAAALEAKANEANLSFDTGESQIVAMMIARHGLAFVSGDKRAARAMSVVLPGLHERMVCFEQVICTMLDVVGPATLREAVCREAAADRAVGMCFQCSRPELDPDEIFAALESYSTALRAETGRLLIGTSDMSGAEVP